MTAFKELDLASLLVSRVCHDLVSPVGAVVNGLEVIADDDDPSMRAEALKLIERSAAQASAKLQFARIAFGASGSRGETLPIGDVREAALKLYDDSRTRLDWQAPDQDLPKAQVRALANLVAVAPDCLPRGGTISVAVAEGEGTREILVRCRGQNARIGEELREALDGKTPLATADGKAVVPLILGLVTRGAKGRIEARMAGEDAVLAASFPR